MLISNKECILKWIEKSKDEEDYFDKFVYGFFALNAMYSIYYDGNERAAIRELFDASFNNHYDEYCDILFLPEFDYFCNRPAIKNCKYDPRKENPGPIDTKNDKMRLLQKSPRTSNRAMLMIYIKFVVICSMVISRLVTATTKKL